MKGSVCHYCSCYKCRNLKTAGTQEILCARSWSDTTVIRTLNVLIHVDSTAEGNRAPYDDAGCPNTAKMAAGSGIETTGGRKAEDKGRGRCSSGTSPQANC